MSNELKALLELVTLAIVFVGGLVIIAKKNNIMEIKELDDAGVKLIADFEGCVLHPYKDQVGIPTIGIGMTYYPETGKKVTIQDKPLASIGEAYRQFKLMAKPKCLAVCSVTRDDINQHQFNALVSLTYNIGDNGFKNSTVLKRVNQHIIGQPLKDAFLMWVKADGKVLSDLVSRRTKEYNLYMTGGDLNNIQLYAEI
jgi:lysozyme